MTNAKLADHVVNVYSSRYDDAITPRIELEAGDTVLTPEYPDAREWSSFRRRMVEAGLDLRWDEHVDCQLGDIYTLVQVKD